MTEQITKLNEDLPDIAEFEWEEGRPERLRHYFAAKQHKQWQREFEEEAKRKLVSNQVHQIRYDNEQAKFIGESYYYSDAYLEDTYV
jgi:hypothetical protein